MISFPDLFGKQGGLLTTVRILPAGKFWLHGKAYVYDKRSLEAFAEIIAETEGRRAIYRNHEDLIEISEEGHVSEPTSTPHALGWFTLAARPEGVYAERIVWGQQGSALLIAEKERREEGVKTLEVSPALWFQENSVRLVDVVSLSIVDLPPS